MAAVRASGPRTSSTVSYWPANDASARSSARADERTAKGTSPILAWISRATPSIGPKSTRPAGTGKPARTSSPSVAAFPPATSRSAKLSASSGTIPLDRSCGLIGAPPSMGKLGRDASLGARRTCWPGRRSSPPSARRDAVQDRVDHGRQESVVERVREVPHQHGVEQYPRGRLCVVAPELAGRHARLEVGAEEAYALTLGALDPFSHVRIGGRLAHHHLEER